MYGLRMRLVVALGGQKGGVGKTTLALLVAYALAVRGRRVVFLDADRQRSALTFYDKARKRRRDVFEVRPLSGDLYEEVAQLKRSHPGDIVIDLPGALGDVQRSAMMVVDVLLLPVIPTALDTWALASSLDTLTAARTCRPGLRAGIVLNMLRAGTADAREVRRDLLASDAVQRARIPVLRTALGLRTPFHRSLKGGRGVNPNAQSNAAREVRALVSELLRMARTTSTGAAVS